MTTCLMSIHPIHAYVIENTARLLTKYGKKSKMQSI